MSLGQSPSQTIGPMYGFALYEKGMEHGVDPDDPDAIWIAGRMLDSDGEPIAYPDALVEIWHGEQFARARTDAFGVWQACMKKPTEVQDLADGRPQAPHLHVTAWARGLLKQAQTRVYFPDEAEANAADPVLSLVEEGRRDLLIARADGDRLQFDICLGGERETPFFTF